jgi:hypothetical protein
LKRKRIFAVNPSAAKMRREKCIRAGEILAEESTVSDGVNWCEFVGFGRFRFAALG